MSYLQSSEQQISINETMDFKRLYQYERDIRQHYQKKVQLMEIKLKKIMLSKHKKSFEIEKRDSNQLIGELKNFKIQIPKSPKNSLHHPASQEKIAINNQNKYPLISNLAIFGLSDNTIRQNIQSSSEFFEGQTIFSTGSISQTVMHAAKLVFPSGITFQKFQGYQSHRKCVQTMSSNYNTIKSFVLSFQPPQGHLFIGSGARKSKEANSFNENILNILNPEKRIYAVCLGIPQYTSLSKSKQNISLSLQETDQNFQKLKSMRVITEQEEFTKSVSLFQIPDDVKRNQQINQTSNAVALAERIYCIFSYYPIFSFFEQILKALINLVKMQRLILFKESNIKSLEETDSNFSVRRIRQLFHSCVQKMANLTVLKFNQIYEIKFINLQKITFSTDLESIKKRYITQWITPVLKLFTIDKFIDVFTLMMLQQKIVFVCQNQHILTYLVFLFTNVLPKPFYYPYPVVNLIPDQVQYLNVPFPVVYGYLQSKNTIIQNKMHKAFRNVYVFVNKNGVQVLSADSIKQTLNKRSSKLRQKLSPWFQKLHGQYIYNLRRFSKIESIQSRDFDFTCSKKSYETSMIIIQEISHYMQTEIHANIPTRVQVQKIRKEIGKQLKEESDITHETYKRIIHIYSKRSKDPFFQQFLHTQLLNVHIFQ